MTCLVCTGPTRAVGTRFDDRYGYPGRYELLGCLSCGHAQLSVSMTEAELGRLYTEFYPRSTFRLEDWCPPREEDGFRSWWRGLRASAFRWVPPNVRVLDIGCGFGESLGYHKARGCDAHGVEADANILRVAQRFDLNVRHGLFDPEHYERDSFDAVTLDQVIEHVAAPLSVLRGVNAVLKPGGILVLSTPNVGGWGARVFGSRWIHWHAPYHQQFFSRASMGRIASEAGFDLREVRTVTNSAWLGFQWGHLLTFPKPGVPSPYWSSSVQRTHFQRIALKFLRAIDLLGINAALTRLADAFGLGDNAVYVLTKRGVPG
jgi:2-polyprenyl-3-methyl-5-hydroxy-6-metoxy-1,4-benzoquinol methylase